MKFLAWASGTWANGAWKKGTWEAAAEEIAPAGGVSKGRPFKDVPLYRPFKRSRKEREADILFLLP